MPRNHPYEKNNKQIIWQETPKSKKLNTCNKPTNITINARGDSQFKEYAEKWVNEMKKKHINENFEEAVTLGTLEEFLIYIERFRKKSTRITRFTFFGHGFEGGFLFDGTEDNDTNCLYSPLIKSHDNKDGKQIMDFSFESNPQKKLHYNLLIKYNFYKFDEIFKNTEFYIFSCYSAEATFNPAKETLESGISQALTGLFGGKSIGALGRIFYLTGSDEFGFSTHPVESRTSTAFTQFKFHSFIRGRCDTPEFNPTDFFWNIRDNINPTCTPRLFGINATTRFNR